MVTICLLLAFLSAFSFVAGALWPFAPEQRLKLQPFADEIYFTARRKSKFPLFRNLSMINQPFCVGALGHRVARDLATGQVDLIPEEFFLIKEIAIAATLFLTYPFVSPDAMAFWLAMGFVIGYMLPEFWLKGRISHVKSSIIKELPDAIDLLALCVNAGLDFMLALKWVVDKSPPTVMMTEFRTVMQEINVGKSRRDALRDLAAKYELPDLNSLARTLIQADKMGTSVAEALNILSEDMRVTRFRRGEQLALKAPLKMLVPLLFFIFPVVGILVAGPIFLDFIQNNPMSQIGGGTK